MLMLALLLFPRERQQAGAEETQTESFVKALPAALGNRSLMAVCCAGGLVGGMINAWR